MNDLISRSALVKWLNIFIGSYSDNYAKGYVDGIKRAIAGANELAEDPTVDAVEVVRCCECKRRYDADECPMCFLIDGEYHEYTNGNGYCDRGERRNGDATD